MRNVSLALAAVLTWVCCVAVAQTAPATQPTTQRVPPMTGASEIVPLWPVFVSTNTQLIQIGSSSRPLDADDVVSDRSKTPGHPDLWVRRVGTPTMAVYLPKSDTPTAAAIICPGGGYVGESATREGINVAQKLNAAGIAAFVLRYRMPDGHAPADGALPVPQQDVLRAIQSVRAAAGGYNVDPKHVGVIGFSAGGHLAATAATLFDQSDTLTDKAGDDAVSRTSARPDFAVLVYPVITMEKGVTHAGSRQQLIGRDADAALEERFSAERHVTASTPPLFIVHAEDDKTVPVANACRMATAAATAGVPCQVVLLQTGGHGFGTGRANTETGTWFDTMLAWMKMRRLTGG